MWRLGLMDEMRILRRKIVDRVGRARHHQRETLMNPKGMRIDFVTVRVRALAARYRREPLLHLRRWTGAPRDPFPIRESSFPELQQNQRV